jgi:hypothetical protein
VIEIGKTIVSIDLFKEKFVCDLQACKGECCVQGDSGAPLEKEELKILEKVYPEVKAYMRPEGIEAVEKQGLYVQDNDGDTVTPLIDGKECAFVVFDEKGIALCAIEKAYKAGKIDFRKPLSCHLYPVRLKEYKDFTAVQYHRWDICSAACKLGEQLNVPLYKFLKEPLIRKFGKAWYDELIEVEKALNGK